MTIPNIVMIATCELSIVFPKAVMTLRTIICESICRTIQYILYVCDEWWYGDNMAQVRKTTTTTMTMCLSLRDRTTAESIDVLYDFSGVCNWILPYLPTNCNLWSVTERACISDG